MIEWPWKPISVILRAVILRNPTQSGQCFRCNPTTDFRRKSATLAERGLKLSLSAIGIADEAPFAAMQGGGPICQTRVRYGYFP